MKAVKRFAIFEKLPQVSLIVICAFRLAIRSIGASLLRSFVRINTEPPQAVKNILLVFFIRTLQVGILYTQYKSTALILGKQIVKKRGTRSADMQISRRARCNSDSYTRHDSNVLPALKFRGRRLPRHPTSQSVWLPRPSASYAPDHPSIF